MTDRKRKGRRMKEPKLHSVTPSLRFLVSRNERQQCEREGKYFSWCSVIWWSHLSNLWGHFGSCARNLLLSPFNLSLSHLPTSFSISPFSHFYETYPTQQYGNTEPAQAFIIINLNPTTFFHDDDEKTPNTYTSYLCNNVYSTRICSPSLHLPHLTKMGDEDKSTNEFGKSLRILCLDGMNGNGHRPSVALKSTRVVEKRRGCFFRRRLLPSSDPAAESGSPPFLAFPSYIT